MKLVQTDAERSKAAGVDSLPTFFIGTHRLVGYSTPAAFRLVLDSALAGH
jgi:protein-disulfide isomerase